MNIKRCKIYYILIIIVLFFCLGYILGVKYNINIVKEKTAYDILKEKLLINN